MWSIRTGTLLGCKTLVQSSHRSKMDLKQVVSKLEELAPLSLAESWDNVGLLVEPSDNKTINNIFLTNDLTEPVLTEAIECKSDLIVSYHPPLFRPMKRFTSKSWKERVAVKCIENKIAVYSPHTSWDAVEGGINSWLVEPYGPGVSVPVTPATSTKFPGGLSHTVSVSGEPMQEYQSNLDKLGLSYQVVERTGGGGVDTVSVSCPASMLGSVMSSLPSHLSELATVTSHTKPPLLPLGQGAGRIITLDNDITLDEALERTKQHLGLEKVRLAIANGANLQTKVGTIGVCAGSGASLLSGVKANLLVTGEMSHHEVLDFVHSGSSVILTDHSNTERGYLMVAKQKLSQLVGPDVNISVSKVDRDPLQIV